MKKKLNLKIGDICLTYGGWECIVIWKRKIFATNDYEYYIVHKPNTDEESSPVFHNKYGEARNLLEIGYIPIYDQRHPADIVIWTKEEIEEAKKKSKQIMEKLNW